MKFFCFLFDKKLNNEAKKLAFFYLFLFFTPPGTTKQRTRFTHRQILKESEEKKSVSLASVPLYSTVCINFPPPRTESTIADLCPMF